MFACQNILKLENFVFLNLEGSLLQDAFIDISNFVQQGYPFIRIVNAAKDIMISRFSIITKTAERIKCILEIMDEFMIREMAENKT